LGVGVLSGRLEIWEISDWVTTSLIPRLQPGTLRIFDFTGGFSPAMSFQIVERQRPVTGHFAGGLGNRRYTGMNGASEDDAMIAP
jgi:hypothetical protein